MRKDFTIGLVVPFATDEVPEEGLQMYPGVRFVARGVGVRALTPEGYDSAWEGILPAAEYLATITSKTTSGDVQYGRGSRQRLVNLDVPEAAISAIEKSRAVPTSIEWSAPRDGIVLERSAIEGMRVQPGGVLFRIADHSVMWALIDIAERDLGLIAKGQPATVRARIGSSPRSEAITAIQIGTPAMMREATLEGTRCSAQDTPPFPQARSSVPTSAVARHCGHPRRSSRASPRRIDQANSSPPAIRNRLPAIRNGGIVRTATRIPR